MRRDADAPDKAVVRQAFNRAALTYDDAAVLQREVRSELLERLDLVKIEPALILDAGSGTGRAGPALLSRYRGARLVAMDLSEGMLRQATSRRLWRRPSRVCGDAQRLPFATDSIDLVFSNLMLQWCDDLDAVFGEIARVLKPEGLFSFSTFGPDTLTELKRSWQAADDRVHVNTFIDMHDIGDGLIRAGLAQPVLDVDYFCLTYDTTRNLMRDLKAIGASNAARSRNRGLTGRGTLAAVEQAYETFRRDGRLPSTWEVVYGHAWASAPRRPQGNETGETRIPISSIGTRGA